MATWEKQFEINSNHPLIPPSTYLCIQLFKADLHLFCMIFVFDELILCGRLIEILLLLISVSCIFKHLKMYLLAIMITISFPLSNLSKAY